MTDLLTAAASLSQVAGNVQEAAYATDTFYFLILGAFVMWMAAGFSMLEAGLVRTKNTTEILTKNVALFAIACIMYMLCGYGFMYPGDAAPVMSYAGTVTNDAGKVVDVIVGTFPGFNGVFDGAIATAADVDKVRAGTFGDDSGDSNPYYSGNADFFFQVVFVATAMSIVSGAVAERMKLWVFLVFAIVMCGFIYPIQGYWNWGGGFLAGPGGLGYTDYAGSGTVHLAGASAALAAVIFLGARKGKYGPNGEVQAIPGSNLPLATLGTFILWFGWFGFNGGSELMMSNVIRADSAALAFVNTNMAACGGAIAALLVARLLFGKADLTMLLNGALAGLVSITAGPTGTGALIATLIGAIGGVLVVFSILSLDKLRLDDPVGAISVHGTAGIWGVLAVGIFGGGDIVSQLIGVVVIFAWCFGLSAVTWVVLKLIFGLRVSEEDEYNGLDLSECGMEAYPEFTK